MSTEVDVEQAIKAARQHYAVLPYHGWRHAQEVMNNVNALVKRSSSQELKAARKTLLIAAAWHDAGYAQDHEALGFKSKEAYSVALAKDYLNSVDAASDTIRIIAHAIAATEHGSSRPTDTSLALHRADVKNIGWLYSDFRTNNVHLWEEDEVLHGSRKSWDVWQQGTLKFVNFSIDEARREVGRLGLPLTGPMSFVTLAERNRDLFVKEPEPSRI